MRDLRISVTDRCNFRCTYCMPAEIFGRDYEFLPRDQVLSSEEIEPVAGRPRAVARKPRSPAASRSHRRDCRLIAMLAVIAGPTAAGGPHPDHLRFGVRGSRDPWPRRVSAGSGRLYSLDDAVFGAMNGIDFLVAKVLDGIDAAREVVPLPLLEHVTYLLDQYC